MKIFRIHCAKLLIITFPLSAMAQGSENGFWGSLDAGWANVNFRHSISGSHTSGEFAMDFYAGYHWAEKYYGAIELGGLNLEATKEMGDGDPTKGVGIQHAMLSLRYYGDPEVPWFLLGAAGKAHYWTNHVGENGEQIDGVRLHCSSRIASVRGRRTAVRPNQNFHNQFVQTRCPEIRHIKPELGGGFGFLALGRLQVHCIEPQPGPC